MQSVPVPVIQSLGPAHLHPAYPMPYALPPQYRCAEPLLPGAVKLGTPPSNYSAPGGVLPQQPPSNYIGVPPPVIPGYPASGLLSTSLAGPSLYNGEAMSLLWQPPIMSTVSQPSSAPGGVLPQQSLTQPSPYLQSHHHMASVPQLMQVASDNL